MFITRALTVLIALPVFAAALILSPQWLWALLLLPALFIASGEWAALAGYGAAGRIAYSILNVLTALALFYLAPYQLELATFAVSCAFWATVAPTWLARCWTLRNPLVLGIVGWIALTPMWLALVRLQIEPRALLLFLSVVWIADTFAYLAGRRWGRHKLAPRISPGKSWEGVAGAAVALALYYAIVWLALPLGAQVLPPWSALALFAALLALSIEGDLFESWMKRQAGVKDSGRLLPGHGGLLDRIDGLTSTMPAAALALYLH
jgi:phosphatidate cytidylyltransferase